MLTWYIMVFDEKNSTISMAEGEKNNGKSNLVLENGNAKEHNTGVLHDYGGNIGVLFNA